MKPTRALPTVLAVDDTEDVLDIIDETLRHHFTVKLARDAAKGELLAAAQPIPDVILLDVVMPGRSGYDLCHALKGNPATANIPVIFLSGSASLKDQVKGFAAGGVDYIPKPISPLLLRARVSVHAELRNQKLLLEKMVTDRTAEIERTREMLIRRLARAAEYHEGPAVTNRVMRISHYAGILARAASASPQVCEVAVKAAPLYDVGKLGVPAEILNKAGSLTEDEWSHIRKHPEIGAEIIGDSRHPLFEMARIMALTHHERWDGAGYPKGLKAKQIPWVGRLMALVDTFESMTTTRFHRERMDPMHAAVEIRRLGGRHFDPELVAAFSKALPALRKVSQTYPDRLGDLLDLDFTA